MANYNVSGSYSGLGTFNIGVPNTGTYKISGSLDLPAIRKGDIANSQVVVTVSINGGSAIYTGTAGEGGFEVVGYPISGAGENVAASSLNIFNVTLSSSAPVDQGLNKVKSTIIVSELS